MLKRILHDEIVRSLSYFPAVAVLGPRQCGKTTLIKHLLSIDDLVYLDLEKPSDRLKINDPELFFKKHQRQTICLDEIQRVPEIFPVLRSLLDEGRRPGQLVILGSASPDLLRQSSESLAGRIRYLELTPFTLLEVGRDQMETLWFRGGFPLSFLAPDDAFSADWRDAFIMTFLERDIPQLGFSLPSDKLYRFLQMVAHMHGSTWNGSKLSASLGENQKTIRNFLDLFAQTFVLRKLPPFATNLKKRVVKSPKVFFRDTGLLHSLLLLTDQKNWLGHPSFGSSFEGFVIENISQVMNKWQLSYYRTSAGAEIDLILQKGLKKIAVEIKASTTPVLTRGFYNALEDVQPDESFVVGLVEESYQIREDITVTNLPQILDIFMSDYS